MPACIQVCPVEIPGRGRREGEPALTDAAELARVLAHALPLQASHMLQDCSLVAAWQLDNYLVMSLFQSFPLQGGRHRDCVEGLGLGIRIYKKGSH